MNNLNKIDHIGVVVKNLDEAVAHYQKAFNAKASNFEDHLNNNIRLCFVEFANTAVELIMPLNESSKVWKFAQERSGLHHICYEVSDIKAELKRFAELGYELIDKEPRQGARGAIIAFIKPSASDSVLFELCEYPNNP